MRQGRRRYRNGRHPRALCSNVQKFLIYLARLLDTLEFQVMLKPAKLKPVSSLIVYKFTNSGLLKYVFLVKRYDCVVFDYTH